MSSPPRFVFNTRSAREAAHVAPTAGKRRTPQQLSLSLPDRVDALPRHAERHPSSAKRAHERGTTTRRRKLVEAGPARGFPGQRPPLAKGHTPLDDRRAYATGAHRSAARRIAASCVRRVPRLTASSDEVRRREEPSLSSRCASTVRPPRPRSVRRQGRCWRQAGPASGANLGVRRQLTYPPPPPPPPPPAKTSSSGSTARERFYASWV